MPMEIPRKSRFREDRRYLYNPVGGGPFPYVLTQDVPGGGIHFGDIVVNTEEDVVIANSAASNDQIQDGFQDDQITGGDEGLGYAQAKRLKQKLGRNKRRVTERGYAVEADAPYDYGFGAVAFKPVNALKGGILGGLVGGFAPKIQLKSRATLERGRASTYDIWYDEAVGGNAGSLENLRQAGGVGVTGMPGPPWPRIAPSQGSKDYAAAKYRQAVALVGAGPRPLGPLAIVPTAPGVPVPAPTSGATDAIGLPLPASIMQASASQPAVGVNQSAAPTASEDVAAQSTGPETMDVASGGLPSFSALNLHDPKVMLTIAGLGIFLFTQMGSKRRGRRR